MKRQEEMSKDPFPQFPRTIVYKYSIPLKQFYFFYLVFVKNDEEEELLFNCFSRLNCFLRFHNKKKKIKEKSEKKKLKSI